MQCVILHMNLYTHVRGCRPAFLIKHKSCVRVLDQRVGARRNRQFEEARDKVFPMFPMFPNALSLSCSQQIQIEKPGEVEWGWLVKW